MKSQCVVDWVGIAVGTLKGVYGREIHGYRLRLNSAR